MTADPQADGIRGPVPSIVTPPPGPRSRELLEGQSKVLYPGLAHGLGPFVIVRKQGDAIEDVDGNVYLDMISAMASVPLGASRPDVTKAAVEALRRYGNEDTHFYSHEFVLPLAEKLLELAPSNLSRVDIALNGTEAIEIAVKFMRRATGRPIVIGFMGGYHGESLVTSRIRTRIARRSLPDRAEPETARSTTCATICCSTRWTRPTSPGSSSSRFSAPAAASRRRMPSGPRWSTCVTSTIGCWSPTRSRPGSDAPARCSPSSGGTCSPT
jgi:4-aminobutyrate aminotransferase-like enzyme